MSPHNSVVLRCQGSWMVSPNAPLAPTFLTIKGMQIPQTGLWGIQSKPGGTKHLASSPWFFFF